MSGTEQLSKKNIRGTNKEWQSTKVETGLSWQERDGQTEQGVYV